LGFAVGLALAAFLMESYGLPRILDLLGRAGWLGLMAVVLFHLIQVLFSAAAWRAVAGPTLPQPPLRTFLTLRWVREGVNNLLPVAQIGGELVAARLLWRRGVPLAQAVAGAIVDLTVEMLTQVGFTLLGLALLLLTVGSGVAGAAWGGLAAAAAVAAGFLAAQWLGLGRLLEAGLVRLGALIGWEGGAEMEGLHAALVGLYRAPRRLAGAAFCHSLSWLLGGAEVCLALHLLGRDVGPAAGLVIESLGQAFKAVAFAVPGALGVQEGGLVVVCGLFGLRPDLALALSLTKRLREAVLGVPALAAWRWLAGSPHRTAANPVPPSGALR
jgi:putative membrane protein